MNYSLIRTINWCIPYQYCIFVSIQLFRMQFMSVEITKRGHSEHIEKMEMKLKNGEQETIKLFFVNCIEVEEIGKLEGRGKFDAKNGIWNL